MWRLLRQLLVFCRTFFLQLCAVPRNIVFFVAIVANNSRVVFFFTLLEVLDLVTGVLPLLSFYFFCFFAFFALGNAKVFCIAIVSSLFLSEFQYAAEEMNSRA